MDIKNVKYVNDTVKNEKDCINATIDGVDMAVPLDPDNRHYQAIQEWVAEGNKIEEAD